MKQIDFVKRIQPVTEDGFQSPVGGGDAHSRFFAVVYRPATDEDITLSRYNEFTHVPLDQVQVYDVLTLTRQDRTRGGAHRGGDRWCAVFMGLTADGTGAVFIRPSAYRGGLATCERLSVQARDRDLISTVNPDYIPTMVARELVGQGAFK